MILKKKLSIGLAVLCAIASVWGCSKPKDDDKAGSTSTTANTPSNGTGETKNGGEIPGLDVSTVPDELKHEGYQYYGLSHTKAIEYEVVRSDGPSTLTGSATTKLTAIENGIAKFLTERTGALSDRGAEEIEARKDGIYNTSIGGKPVEPAQLVMPAELPSGKTWSTKSSIKFDDGQTFEEQLNYKVVGPEQVKAKAGTFDALKISATGQIKAGALKAQATVTAWYVKDKGTVKMTISTKEGSKPAVTMTVQATKLE